MVQGFYMSKGVIANCSMLEFSGCELTVVVVFYEFEKKLKCYTACYREINCEISIDSAAMLEKLGPHDTERRQLLTRL